MADFRLEMDTERIHVLPVGPNAFALCKRLGYSPDGVWVGNRECIAFLKILSDEGMTWESRIVIDISPNGSRVSGNVRRLDIR